MNKKTFIIPAVALAVSGAMLYSSLNASRARAFDTTDWKTSFVQTLADKLGVSSDKVETAVGDIRSENRVEAQSRYEERLGELVQLGKITESQKQLILDKKAELQKEWDAQQSQRQQHQEELRSWASDNGIDLSVIGPIGGMGHMGEGRGMGMGRGGW